VWAEGEAWTVTEDLRIGSFDDPGAYSFGQIIALDVDDYGRIWVLESQAAEVRVFDTDGRHVRTTGGKGGGPGEFAGPAHLQLGPDDHIYGVTQDELGVPYVIRARIEMHPSP
jgi:hypothetical protein